MTWFLDVRAQAVGGGVSREVLIYNQDTPALPGEFESAIENRAVAFVTHGFNVDRENGRKSLGLWEAWQALPANAVYVAVLWPGDSAWIPAIDYPVEGNEAISSGDLLAAFIDGHCRGAAVFSFVSHSLGARVVLQTIRKIGTTTRVSFLMLMAGAIDDNCLDVEYADAARSVESISILASRNDEVLALAFPAGNFASGLFTKGSPYWHAALGREGPGTTLGGRIQQGWEIPNPWAYGHHNYLPQLPPTPATPPLPDPQQIPPLNTAKPAWASFEGWEPAWSAAVTRTRYR